MSNASDFVIENGILKRYVGPGGDVIIPEGGMNQVAVDMVMNRVQYHLEGRDR